MEFFPNIARRTEEPFHSHVRVDLIKRVNIHKTNTRNQGIRIPDILLTTLVWATESYSKYDEAQKAGYVGFHKEAAKSVGVGMRKTRGRKAASDSGSVTKQPARPKKKKIPLVPS